MNPESLFLVTGATGTTGRAAAEELVRRGARVRAMVRRPQQRERFGPDVEVVVADMADPASLPAAVQGVDAMLLISPLADTLPLWQEAMARAAQAAGVRRIVKVSTEVAFPQAPDVIGRWHHEAEQAVQRTGVAWYHVRPCNFMQNLFSFAAPIARDGAFWAPLGDARISLVDARDVGAVSAAVLLRDDLVRGHVVVTGSDRPTYDEFAEQVGRAIGRPVRYQPVTTQEALARFAAGGMPAWKADALTSMYRYLQDPATTQLTSAVADLTGRAPRRLDDFVAEHAQGFAAGTLRH